MADEIVQWLEELGLGQYAQAFADNDIGLDVLPQLTEEHLKDLGVSLGDRLRLQTAIKEFGEDQTIQSKTSAGKEWSDQSREAERRQLSVLFCDLVSSTALASRLDPEDMREILRTYQDACSGVIARYEGYVAKFMGDGVYAYFGYPRAHEDDAERAINAGLGIVEAIGALPNDLQVRIGIATGTVAVGDIVGEGASEEANVVGEAPNLAARLQELAEPDAIVIGEATHALAGGLFETSTLGHRALKGFAEPIGAWRVHRLRRAESRFEATRGENLTEIIGRDEEIEILLRRWQRATTGEGQVVLISGEPGIGKSRLVREVQERVGVSARYRLRHQCSPFHANSALYPVIEQVERAARFEIGDDTETRLDKIETLLAESNTRNRHAPALFASMLSVRASDRYPEIEVGSQRQKELTLQALVDQLVGLADQGPVLFVLEDAHWIDPTTLELLDLIVERVATASVLVVITCRPEFASPWTGRAHVTLLPLNRLSSRDCAAMAEVVIGDRSLPEEVREQIVEKTDGVPLFVEELTKSLLDLGVLAEEGKEIVLRGALNTMAVPATLQDSLEARLDRVPAVREVAQIGSVIGREFPYALLAEVAPLDAGALRDALSRLVASELVFVRGEPPESRYTFKHALVQDTAYASLLRGRKRELHGRIAEVLQGRGDGTHEAEPEILAHHFAEAGEADKAVHYRQLAAKHATARSANWEAVAHFETALEILAGLPETRERDERELELLVDLFTPLVASKGYNVPEAENASVRALELCRRIGETPRIFPVLYSRYSYFLAVSRPARALEFAEDYLRRAERDGDQTLRMIGHRMLGSCSHFVGHWAASREHLENVLDIYDDDAHSHLGHQYGHDPKVAAISTRAIVLWALGHVGLAHECILTARDAVRSSSHPNSTCYGLGWIGVAQSLLGDRDGLEECARELSAVSEEYVIPFWGLYARFFWALFAFEASDWEDSTHVMKECFERVPAETWPPIWTYFGTRLADALGHSGQADEAIGWLDRAQAIADSGGERWAEPEIWRIRGDLSFLHGDPVAAEASYRQAIHIARTQSAPSWELRAAVGLARLWHSQGKPGEARDLLAPVYAWFTEGLDTADLKDAKALLDRLS